MEKILEFSPPEREYYVAPRKSRKRRRRPLAVPFLLGVLLFAGGFLLGKASAAPADEAPAPESETPANVLDDGIIPEPPAVSGTQSTEDWALLLVNWENPLGPDFAVPELTRLKNGHTIDSRVYPSLQAMMDAARAEGLQPLICSSYRTWDKQAELFEAKAQSYLDQGFARAEAEEKAAAWVARPGTSEHQAGLAVDIVDVSYQLLDKAQEDTPVQRWLMAHCAEYGFILRYPTEKSALTGVSYEPWHYRYVGLEAARAIMDRGLCLEEYLAE